MKEILTRNIGLKIAMLILAIPVWLILVNIANPMSTKVINGVEVHVLNEDAIISKGQIYSISSSKTVSMVVTARKMDIANISADDFYVYADMKYCYGENDYDKACQLQWQIVANNDIIDADTVGIKGEDFIKLSLENVISRDFAVKVNYINEPADDITIGNTLLDPATISIAGPESKLASVAQVAVTIDASKINADTQSVTAKIHLYNSNGKEIVDTDKMSISDLSVSATPEVLRSKTLTIAVGDVHGTPAEGYGYTGMVCDISGVKVIGLKAALAELTTVTIPDEYLSIEGATSDVTVAVDLRSLLPENVTIADDVDKVNITLKVEKLKIKAFRLPTQNIVIQKQNDEYTYSFTLDNLLVNLKGFEEDLEKIKAEDIIATVDVEDLEPGLHTVPVVIDEHDGYTLVSELTIGIRIKDKPVSTSEDSSTTSSREENVTESNEDKTETESESEESREQETEPVTESVPETEEPVTNYEDSTEELQIN